jgi:polysaccharide biosynthesis PFTS motif protein
MNWPLYLVWDNYQEQLVKRNVNEYANTIVVGTVWLNSSPNELPQIPDKSIVVFDIPALRSSSHFGFSTLAELDDGNANGPIDFLRDIDEALVPYGGTIIHKRKRKNADKHLHKRYSSVLAELSYKKKLISIEPDTSPIRIIEKCLAVISMPFTSTAIIGRDLGKPSVYYDPTGLIQKDDRGAHGIPVITGKEELALWMKTIFEK